MKIIQTKNLEELSELTAQILLGEMSQDQRVNLSLTAGASPKLIYEQLTPIIKANPTRYQNVHYYNFDNLGDHQGGITMQLLNQQVYQPAGIPDTQIHQLNQHNYHTWDQEIADAGGINLMLIGLGADGHFCGNIPGFTNFTSDTYRVDLDQLFQQHPHYKDDFEGQPLPKYMVTMGLKSLLKVRKLIMIVNGAHKAEILRKMLEPKLDPNCPSSYLQLHSNFTLIVDQDAASLL
jgi:6-phosphogluconolactonase/glucosamine-6-phosphate isomerase/deaminase